jgi:hypothetical protein
MQSRFASVFVLCGIALPLALLVQRVGQSAPAKQLEFPGLKPTVTVRRGAEENAALAA